MPAASAFDVLGPDHAVALEARRLLEGPHGLLGQRPERAVGGAEPVAELRRRCCRASTFGPESPRTRLVRGFVVGLGVGFGVGVGFGSAAGRRATAWAWRSSVGVGVGVVGVGVGVARLRSASGVAVASTAAGLHRPGRESGLPSDDGSGAAVRAARRGHGARRHRPAPGEQHGGSRQRGSRRSPRACVLVRPIGSSLRLVHRLPTGPPADGTGSALASRRAGRDRLVAWRPTPAASAPVPDRLVGRDHLAGDLDVEVLDHLPRWVTTPAPSPASQAASDLVAPPRPPRPTARTPRCTARPGRGGSGSCRRSRGRGPGGTRPRSRRGRVTSL